MILQVITQQTDILLNNKAGIFLEEILLVTLQERYRMLFFNECCQFDELTLGGMQKCQLLPGIIVSEQLCQLLSDGIPPCTCCFPEFVVNIRSASL